MNNKYSEVCKTSQSQSQGQSHCQASLAETLRATMKQVDYEKLNWYYVPLAYELCMIIAEVKILPPHFEIRINGNTLTASLVSEVYGSLNRSCIEMVIEKFRNIGYEVKYRKSYFRTALYNAAFETESYYENEVRKDDDA